MKFLYRFLFCIDRLMQVFLHPVFHVYGRENIPEGAALLAANHSAVLDPAWILLALRSPNMIRVLSKYELSKVFILGWLIKKFDIILVHRNQHDTKAYEECVEALKQGEKLLIFPEGTRCNKNKHVRAKTGGVRMAIQSGAPIVPVFVSRNRTLFSPLVVCFGQPYFTSGIDLEDWDAVQAASDEMLRKIYLLGGDGYADKIGKDSRVLLRS